MKIKSGEVALSFSCGVKQRPYVHFKNLPEMGKRAGHLAVLQKRERLASVPP